MKHLRHLRIISLATFMLWMASTMEGQQTIFFKTGNFLLLPIDQSARQVTPTQYLFYQADHVLTLDERNELSQAGLEILYALHNHLYWVRVTKAQGEIVAGRLFNINPDYKVGIDLSARSNDNRYRLTIAPGMTQDELIAWAELNQINILDTRMYAYGFIDVEVQEGSAEILRNTPWVSFIGSIPHDEEVNYRAHHGERGWGLTSILTRGLNGSGITIGIGDGGRLNLHDDLKTAIIDLSSFSQSEHATQVSGIVAGAGLIDPFYGYGYAPKANVILRNFSDILWDAPQYITDFGLSLTNNSYGTSLDDCVYFGDYDGTSAGLDAMVTAHPQLLHVFAAANSGGMTCSPYPVRYATLAGGYQPAKNVLTAGAVGNDDANSSASFSSRGPTDDGRLKPEVVAYGAGRFTTINNHQYGSNSGTSFSSPATSGIATLLYQRYRQLHADSLPDAALIKNVICNAAEDLGNAGPDYTYGFGRINGVRAVEILESGHYTSVNVDHGNVVTKTMSIPSGTGLVDVMLMWSDPASAPFETVTLVNDLDLTVITPAGDTVKPWKLNYTPSGVANAAGTGADHINNYEQVTISTPVSGTYTLVVKGYQVPMGPQKAWLSWDVCLAGITVQGPIGGEVYKPGNPAAPNDKQYVRWDAFGTGTSTFTTEYSTNGGSSWTTIASAIPANRRYQEWFPPNVPTDQLKVRVTATNGMQDVSDQNAVIMAAPGTLTVPTPCRGYVQPSWSAVPGASYYRLYTIKDEILTAIDTTSATSIVLDDFPPDTAVWVTVSGVFTSGVNGLRARAVSVTANGGNNCAWSSDLRVDSLVALSTGRILTSTTLTATEPVTVRITNTGTSNASGFTMSYLLNNNPVFSEAFPGTINAGTALDYTFTKLADMAATGTYTLKVWVTYASDPLHQNDTITKIIHHLPNPALTLPWTENFDAIPDATIIASSIGLPQLAAWDAYLQPNARVRSFAGDPFSHSGGRAMTVDAIRTQANKSANLTLTLNLDNYSASTDDVRLSLYAMHHEIYTESNNNEAIYIRGDDNDPYVLLANMSNDASVRGQWQYLSGLQLSTALANAGQDFSSSTQIKFTAGVYASAGQLNSEDGQTIDDLSIDLVQKDIKVGAILQPVPIACDLGVDTIKITIVNTSALAVTNTTAYYKLNNGTTYSTFVGTVPAVSTINVSLLPPADFSAPGTYDLKVWVNSADDDFHFNDTTRLQVLHTPMISTYPYVEGFEQDNGGYVSGGIKSSWAHGVPGKQLMSRGAEGQKIWTTSLYSTHNADETSYLYSPCFDITGLVQPYLSFALQYQLETGYDYAWVEYRTGSSNSWTKLGTQGSGVNWYNNAGHQWNGELSKWTTTGIAIPVTNTTIQFRWVLQSDVGVEEEGLAIDQVTVYDRKPLYTGVDMQWTVPVSGNNWVHVDQGGQRVFSIHPQGQDLGDVTVSIYKSAGNFHLSDSLYLLSRNWVLTSTIPPSTAIQLRAYFTKDEATNLVNATGCPQCVGARDGFDFAALRYTGINEDGSYSNDIPGQVITYALDSTEIVPFDNGYYAEWGTTGLSEWWITSSVTKWTGAIERQISSAYDDAEEHPDNGAVNPVRETLTLTEHDGQQRIGWRFKNITVPQGSYIASARMQWISKSTSSLASSWTLQSELVADAASFITSKYNISLRPRSTQVVQWAPSPWLSAGTVYESPDIRHLVQQVVDQPSWVNGNDMVLTLKGSGLRDAWSYDGDPLKGARLVLTYDTICSSTGICYVDKNATGLQDGSSWTDAYRSLEQALDRAAHCPAVSQIWIADGIYSPYTEVSRNNGYSIPPGVSIYGGFEGTETAIGQRIYGAFPTILTGDIGITGVTTDNLYHVMTMQAGMTGSLIDGITIKDGLANGVTVDLQRGSGLNNLGSITTQQVTILGCSAPAVYNSPGALLTAGSLLEVKQ